MGRVALLAVAISLTACAAKPPVIYGERMPAGCTKKTKSERCIGWLLDRVLMMVVFKKYPDEEIRRYVEGIGLRIAATSGLEKRPWKFRLLEDADPQAYSGFNSTIYLTRGVIGILRDEAELASVIAHEMSHTVASHNRESIMEFGSDTAMTEVEAWRDRRYARDDEIQADELAVVMLARAGYDVHGYERMLRALGAGNDDEDASDKRHPIFRERIARAVALASRYANANGERAEERFNGRVAKLVVGTDPRTVTVLDGKVIFANAGIAIDLPEGARVWTFFGILFVVFSGEELAAMLQLSDKRVVGDVKNDKPDEFTEVKILGEHALSITALQDPEKPKRDLAAVARSLAGRTRAPTPTELARLHPIHFDPTVPRPLWAN